jgi:RNA polymerase sigma-70 factor (ECF subfamily)
MEGTPALTDGLIQRAQDGDQDAFGELFELFLAPVFRYVFFRVGDEQQAEKLAEEIFLRTWKDLKKFRLSGKNTFSAWLFQTSHRTVGEFLERLEKSSVDRRNFLESKEVEGEKTGENEERRELAKALQILPEAQSEAIILRYFCNLSNNEIGFLLEKTEGAVRILQSRGLKKLRELLEIPDPLS